MRECGTQRLQRKKRAVDSLYLLSRFGTRIVTRLKIFAQQARNPVLRWPSPYLPELYSGPESSGINQTHGACGARAAHLKLHAPQRQPNRKGVSQWVPTRQ